MKYLKIETERSAYSPEDLGRSMSVRDLIDYLMMFDDDTKVILSNDNGYTYGEVKEENIQEIEVYDEDEEEIQ